MSSSVAGTMFFVAFFNGSVFIIISASLFSINLAEATDFLASPNTYLPAISNDEPPRAVNDVDHNASFADSNASFT